MTPVTITGGESVVLQLNGALAHVALRGWAPTMIWTCLPAELRRISQGRWRITLAWRHHHADIADWLSDGEPGNTRRVRPLSAAGYRPNSEPAASFLEKVKRARASRLAYYTNSMSSIEASCSRGLATVVSR